MTPRPRVVVGALRERVPRIDVGSVALPDLAEHVTRHRPEVVVVAALPVDGVIETLHALRERHRDLRLMLVTSDDGADVRLRALEIGVDDALPPIPVEELAGRLAIFLA